MTNLVRRFQARSKPNSYDPETRSFTVVVATSAPVNCGSHFEILDLVSFGATGWPESLPLQTDHSISVRDTVGILSNFRLETIEGDIQALIGDW